MTDEQKEKIKQLRQQGIGYKQIANEIGLSRDSVRGYCRKHGLDGFGEELAMKHKMLMQEEFIYILCLQCGKEIKQNATGRKRKYCSMECKRLWDKIHRKAFELKCSYCGKEFKSLGIKHLKYCSRTAILKIGFGEMKMLKKLPIKF
ncbi:RNA polymerase subunit sigma-24 [Clostridium novyi]|uniref:RNA polymerase subunit sigma-24 n=1 Tax=Clostridium novyi TaxID=1542 RepID=UPI001FA94692|nr:RNA polymerase subunit sigma-24 [Clostridium novyi]